MTQLYIRTLQIFFTSEENRFAVAYEFEHLLAQGEDDYRVILPRRYDFFEVMALVEIQPKMTSYIEEKGLCRTETIPELITDNNFTEQLRESCGNDACIPKELYTNDSAFEVCEDMHDWTNQNANCAFKTLHEKAKKSDNQKISLRPCNNLEYLVDYKLAPIHDILPHVDNVFYQHNYKPDKTNYFFMYSFKQPESVTYIEEYYTVPIMDLVGLAGGTLGIFIGFSFYGSFAWVLDLVSSVTLKVMETKSKTGNSFTFDACFFFNSNFNQTF